MLETLFSFTAKMSEIFAGSGIRFSPIYIPSFLLIAYLIYRYRSNAGSFFAWLFPRNIYLHKSHFVDIKLFVLGRVLAAFGLFNNVAVSAVTAAGVLALIGGKTLDAASWHPIWITLLLVIAADFKVYWVHRIHHEMALLWPFHSVHHSAEVLTPVTVYRKHPIYDLISTAFGAVILGILQGVLLGFFVGKVEISTIAGSNLIYFLFNFLGSNLRHSHIWLSYGPWVERIFISPAQHQIHHSLAQKHNNKNYGEVLAVWDWMFGTLYVPQTREELTFGLLDDSGQPQAQIHGSLSKALIRPCIESWRALTGGGNGDVPVRPEKAVNK